MRRRAGFNIVEMAVTLGVFALLLASLLSLRPSPRNAAGAGAAALVAEELRSLREQAIAQGEPHVFSVPSGLGSGYYVARGDNEMRIVRVRDFGDDFQGATAFLGSYPTSASVTLTSPVTFQVDDLVLPVPADPALIFLPSGEVTSNGLPLIDGRGAIWWPKACDTDALWDYTLGAQVTETYDFTRAMTIAAREFAPDLFVITGPGTTLGGAVAQSLILAGWLGMGSKDDFRTQQDKAPLLASMGMPEQRAIVSKGDA